MMLAIHPDELLEKLSVWYIFSIFIIIWFTMGGLKDLKVMLTKLKTEYRDHQDDGWVARKN